MYLSRLILDPRSRQVQTEIARPYEMHRTIMNAFADELDKDQERVLFRLDAHPQTGLLALLVQSYTQPNWAWLHNTQTHGYLLAGPRDNPAVKEFDPHCHRGQALVFRLFANPTKRSGHGDDKGKRVGLYSNEEQISWLHRKATQNGFVLVSAMPSGQQRLDDSRRQLKLLGVRFDGILQVVKPEQFRQALETGIGSGKAFGFGMLSIALVNPGRNLPAVITRENGA